MKIVAANLKMNLNYDEIKEYINGIDDINNKNVIIIPTSIYAPYFLNKGYSVGIQNCYYLNKGAYTGEVSPSQIKSIGLDYVLIGHSERRSYFNEDNGLLNKKIKEALNNGLKVIYCIGETLEERESGKTNEVLKTELLEGLKDINEEIIIAYEPVWAIGTNITPTSEEIKETIGYIKSIYNYPTLYGGSTNDKNIEELNSISNVDGFLIGGASLDPLKLQKIIRIVM